MDKKDNKTALQKDMIIVLKIIRFIYCIVPFTMFGFIVDSIGLKSTEEVEAIYNMERPIIALQKRYQE